MSDNWEGNAEHEHGLNNNIAQFSQALSTGFPTTSRAT